MKVLKFGAVWCVDCLVMRPIWEEIEKAVPELVTEYFDADVSKEMLETHHVENIPTFIFLDKDGKEFERMQGMQNKRDLLEFIEKNLDK